MDYLSLFTPYNVAELHDWLREEGELYVDLYFSHRGMGSVGYLVHSLSDLKELISIQDWPDIEVTIFRRKQYPIRGIANSELIRRATSNIPDGSEFHVISPDVCYPSKCLHLGGGDSHTELIRELKSLEGKRVAVGVDPEPTMKWAISNPEEAMYFSVMRNRRGYQPFSSQPNRYEDEIRKWFE